MATTYPYDVNLALHVSAAITATGVGSVAYFDVGGAYRFPAVAVVNVTASDFTTGDETYDVIIEGAAASSFATIKQLGSMTILGGVTGRFTILFDNDQGGTVYQFIRVKFTLAGTTPSITSDVFLAPLFPVA